MVSEMDINNYNCPFIKRKSVKSTTCALDSWYVHSVCF